MTGRETSLLGTGLGVGLLVGAMAASMVIAVIDKPDAVTLIGDWSVSTLSQNEHPIAYYASCPGITVACQRAQVRIEGWVHWKIEPER